MRRERCPVCGALPGVPCQTPLGYILSRPHLEAVLLDPEARVPADVEDEPRVDTDWPADCEQ